MRKRNDDGKHKERNENGLQKVINENEKQRERNENGKQKERNDDGKQKERDENGNESGIQKEQNENGKRNDDGKQKERNGDGRQKKPAFWSQFTFSYAEPLLRKGYEGHKIEAEDLFDVDEDYTADKLSSSLQREWDKEWQKHKRGKGTSFMFAVARTFWRYYTFTGIFYVIEQFSRLLQPMLFSWLVDYLTGSSEMSTTDAWICTILLCVTILVMACMSPIIVQRHCSAANRWHVATTAIMYKKIMRLSRSSINDITVGHVVELFDKDSYKYYAIIWDIHTAWVAPIKAAVAFWFMYRRLGYAVVVGYVVLFVWSPFQAYLSAKVSNLLRKRSKAIDERVQLMTEIISGIKVIKMYCWEKPFGELLANLRKIELERLWGYRTYCSIFDELFTFNSRMIAASVVTASVLFGYGLEASSIFPMFAFFDIVNDTLLNLSGYAFRTFLEFRIAMKRIEKFLLTDEMKDVSEYRQSPSDTSIQLSVSNMSAKWEEKQSSSTLTNITIEIPTGKLVAVVGKVGAGKSSLLSALIGEMEVTNGTICMEGTAGYASQLPWLISDTLRANVLLGMEHNPLVFKQIMDATALSEDLASFSHGELTRIGEKGVTLSGGQKARLSLARAMYQDADVYFLDDPLSAVDTRVGRHIFKKCIKDYLKTKTRILVTHQLQYLKEADMVIVMDSGRIVFQGRYQDIYSDSSLRSLLPKHVDDDEDDDRIPDGHVTKENPLKIEEEEKEDEEDEKSKMGCWEVIKGYFGSTFKIRDMVFVICLNILSQAAFNGADWWLAIWTQNHRPGCPSVSYYLTVFMLLTGSILVIRIVRNFVFFRYTLRLSKLHHDNMYSAVVRAPIRFFDTNPSGRILNRFSSDLGTIDGLIPYRFLDLSNKILFISSTLSIVLYVQPLLVIPGVFMVLCMKKIRAMFVKGQAGSVELESNARSPLLTHLKATIEGLETIRSSSKQGWCVQRFEALTNTLHGRCFTNLSTFSWFHLRMNVVVSLFSVCTVLSFMLARGYVDPTLTAVSFNYLLPVMWAVNHLGRVSAHYVAELKRAGRVLQYSTLSPEAPLKGDSVPPSWPAKGQLTFKDVDFKYHEEGNLILKRLNIHVQAGEKIGVVGRTGAGKSSLIQALFRMAECQGEIIIDDIAISSAGLHDIRGNISIIPQDPVLFSGPVRRNLDPFKEYKDDQLWKALRDVQMDDVIRLLPEELDSPVSEGGSNFSVGQRQLLCLARAILKHNKILVMDEATANVDRRTDELIQETIRKVFNKCTVLTIAHRLNTIMDCDKILVIQDGSVAEFDEPHVLLQNPEGILSRFVADTGKAEQQRLRDIAQETYILKTSSSESD